MWSVSIVVVDIDECWSRNGIAIITTPVKNTCFGGGILKQSIEREITDFVFFFFLRTHVLRSIFSNFSPHLIRKFADCKHYEMYKSFYYALFPSILYNLYLLHKNLVSIIIKGRLYNSFEFKRLQRHLVAASICSAYQFYQYDSVQYHKINGIIN